MYLNLCEDGSPDCGAQKVRRNRDTVSPSFREMK